VTIVQKAKMGFGTPMDGPHCVNFGEKTRLPLEKMTIKKDGRGDKTIKSPLTHTIIGRHRTIKRGPATRLLSFYHGKKWGETCTFVPES
jgi:hypothetical protein